MACSTSKGTFNDMAPQNNSNTCRSSLHLKIFIVKMVLSKLQRGFQVFRRASKSVRNLKEKNKQQIILLDEIVNKQQMILLSLYLAHM